MELMKMWQFWMLCAGVLGAILCLLWIQSTRKFLRIASRTSGHVRELVRSVDADGDVYYKPRFTFTTPDKIVHSVVSAVGSNPSPFRVGESVTVLCDPVRPDHARIDSVGQLWLLPAIFLAVSVILIVVACCSLLAGSLR